MQYLEWKETITFNRLIKFIDHISFFTESVFEIKSKKTFIWLNRKWNTKNTDIYTFWFRRLFMSSVLKSRFHICVLNVNFSFTAHDASLSSNHTQTCTKKMFRINIMLDKRRGTIISKSKVQFITRIVWCACHNFHDRNIKGI